MNVNARRAPRVIIAEDDEEMRKLLVEQFVRHGWDAREAVDGADLLAQIERSEKEPVTALDLIISDERMPRMCGLEVLQALAAEGVRCPFILITSFGEPELHEAAELLGARMTLDKPVDLAVLVDMAAAVVAADDPSL